MSTTTSPATAKTRSFDPSVWFRSRRIMAWEIGGIFFINLLGGYLHFAYELSNYKPWVAIFASVNESTWEHLKFYFFSGLLLAIVQYTYVKDEANNYVFGKALGLLVTPFVVALTFYGYLAYALPVYGKGFLWADIGTGVVGVIVGQMVSSYFLQKEPLGKSYMQRGWAILIVMTIMFSTFTYFPPKMRLFEDYYGYTYDGQYGILEDYEPYRVFERADEE